MLSDEIVKYLDIARVQERAMCGECGVDLGGYLYMAYGDDDFACLICDNCLVPVKARYDALWKENLECPEGGV